MNARSIVLMAALIGLTGVLTTHVLADPPPDLESRRIKPQQDYAQVALDAYGDGYALIERATRFEHDAHAARTDHARTEALRGAAESYHDALKSFEEAVRADDRMYEAHTYIGYVQRQLGRYDEAMSAYVKALTLKPNYVRAIEYQGEAYLGLDRFDDARFNYMRLYALDQTQAAKLLEAMRGWVKAREVNARGISQAQLQVAAKWVREQKLEVVAEESGTLSW